MADGSVSRVFLIAYRNAAGVFKKHGIGALGEAWTAETARAHAVELLRSTQQGADPTSAAQAKRAEWSLNEAADEFLIDRKSGPKAVAPSTAREDEALLRNHIRPAMGTRRLSEISPDHVLALHRKIAKAGKARQADKAVLTLRAMFTWLRGQRIFKGEDPTREVKVAPTKHAARAVRDDQFRALLLALREEQNPDARDALLALLFSGVRRGNALAMRWDQLNLSGRTWTIPKTKNGEAHTVALAPHLVEMLRERQAASGSPWVFPAAPRKDGKPSKVGHMSAPNKAWGRVKTRAEFHMLAERLQANGVQAEQAQRETTAQAVQRFRSLAEGQHVDTLNTSIAAFRIHDLRATFATQLVGSGQNTVMVAKMLGHKTLAMAQRYAVLHEDTSQRVADDVAARMLEAAGIKAPADVVPMTPRARTGQ